ncbi:uncharacterized protein TNCV_771461 [Trichonephila clavipes]|nr:uncharacterized protein TNCV_771461 [Trichonephila clavipes]
MACTCFLKLTVPLRKESAMDYYRQIYHPDWTQQSAQEHNLAGHKPSGQGNGLGTAACHEFERGTSEDSLCRGAMHVKSVEYSNVLPWVWYSKKIELREDLKSRRGLAVSLEIICHNCGESTSTMSSKISNKCYDVNLRLTYGMRAIGKGGAAARIFCGLMNLPPPPAKFERHNSLFLNFLKTISEDSMNAAVHEAVIANDNNSNIAVAVDGTWHKRIYSSLNGVVCATSVENGKVIDFEALTKYCSSCKGKKTM